ncbi:hypothetical protein [Pedobacter psychrophilus]|nr:hypothetical protein [Pedobacter psychrophilus]
MKNFNKKFLVALLGIVLLTSTFSIQKAEAVQDPATAIAEAITAIIGAVCPDTPQNRCKAGNTCQDGACISFRKACSTNEDCGGTNQE